MSTITAIDYRRTDQRTTVLENPFWLTSGIITCNDAKTLGAILFSFPKAGRIMLVSNILVQMITTATATATIDIGVGSLATDAVTTGGTLTYSAVDGYIKTADQTLTAGAVYGPGSGGSTWLTAHLAQLSVTSNARFIVGAATTVPVIAAFVGGTVTAGSFRVHALVTILPGT
jgi:hypothetical protein